MRHISATPRRDAACVRDRRACAPACCDPVRDARKLPGMSKEPNDTTTDIAGPEIRMALGSMVLLLIAVAIVTIVS